MTRARELYTGDPAIQEAVRDLNDRVADIQRRTIVPGTLLEKVAFVAGNNTLLHRLQRRPKMWFVSGIKGAFGAASAGGIYPEISPPRRHGEDQTGSGTDNVSFTLGFTPADGATLIAVVTHEGHSNSCSSLTQTGVTWARVSSASVGTASVNMMGELWIGHTIASAGTGITATFGATFSTQAGILVAEIPEIAATAARNSADAEYEIAATGSRYFDSGQVVIDPVPAAGDVCIAAFVANFGTTRTPPTGHGWTCIAAHTYSGDTEAALIFVKTAQDAVALPLIGNQSSTGFYVFLRANFASSLSAGGSVTIPHGFTEVSKDNQKLVLNSANAVTADVWVA